MLTYLYEALSRGNEPLGCNSLSNNNNYIILNNMLQLLLLQELRNMKKYTISSPPTDIVVLNAVRMYYVFSNGRRGMYYLDVHLYVSIMYVRT